MCVEVIVATIVLIFDGEAEDVARPEAGAVVHTAVEERVGVGVLDVQDLTGGRHVTCNTLICWNTKLLLHSHAHTHRHTHNCLCQACPNVFEWGPSFFVICNFF